MERDRDRYLLRQYKSHEARAWDAFFAALGETDMAYIRRLMFAWLHWADRRAQVQERLKRRLK